MANREKSSIKANEFNKARILVGISTQILREKPEVEKAIYKTLVTYEQPITDMAQGSEASKDFYKRVSVEYLKKLKESGQALTPNQEEFLINNSNAYQNLIDITTLSVESIRNLILEEYDYICNITLEDKGQIVNDLLKLTQTEAIELFQKIKTQVKNVKKGKYKQDISLPVNYLQAIMTSINPNIQFKRENIAEVKPTFFIEKNVAEFNLGYLAKNQNSLKIQGENISPEFKNAHTWTRTYQTGTIVVQNPTGMITTYEDHNTLQKFLQDIEPGYKVFFEYEDFSKYGYDKSSQFRNSIMRLHQSSAMLTNKFKNTEGEVYKSKKIDFIKEIQITERKDKDQARIEDKAISGYVVIGEDIAQAHLKKGKALCFITPKDQEKMKELTGHIAPLIVKKIVQFRNCGMYVQNFENFALDIGLQGTKKSNKHKITTALLQLQKANLIHGFRLPKSIDPKIKIFFSKHKAKDIKI